MSWVSLQQSECRLAWRKSRSPCVVCADLHPQRVPRDQQGALKVLVPCELVQCEQLEFLPVAWPCEVQPVARP